MIRKFSIETKRAGDATSRNVVSRIDSTKSLAPVSQRFKSKVRSINFLNKIKKLRRRNIDDESQVDDFFNLKFDPYTSGSDNNDSKAKFLALNEGQKLERTKELWKTCIK